MIRNTAAVLSKLYLRHPFLVGVCSWILSYLLLPFPHVYPFVPKVEWCGLGLGSFFPPQALVLPLSTLSLLFICQPWILQGLGIIALRWVANTNYFSLAHPNGAKSWCKGLDSQWVSNLSTLVLPCCLLDSFLGLHCPCFINKKWNCTWTKLIFWGVQQVHYRAGNRTPTSVNPIFILPFSKLHLGVGVLCPGRLMLRKSKFSKSSSPRVCLALKSIGWG